MGREALRSRLPSGTCNLHSALFGKFLRASFAPHPGEYAGSFLFIHISQEPPERLFFGSNEEAHLVCRQLRYTDHRRTRDHQTGN
jgi:hypothetical protein